MAADRLTTVNSPNKFPKLIGEKCQKGRKYAELPTKSFRRLSRLEHVDSCRLAIHNQKRSALLYSASDIEVLTRAQVTTHAYLAKLGPDVLCVAPTDVLEQLREQKHRRRQFSALFLDQGFLAGIGNYLRSEILFTAGLHPHLRPNVLNSDFRHSLPLGALRRCGTCFSGWCRLRVSCLEAL